MLKQHLLQQFKVKERWKETSVASKVIFTFKKTEEIILIFNIVLILYLTLVRKGGSVAHF